MEPLAQGRPRCDAADVEALLASNAIQQDAQNPKTTGTLEDNEKRISQIRRFPVDETVTYFVPRLGVGREGPPLHPVSSFRSFKGKRTRRVLMFSPESRRRKRVNHPEYHPAQDELLIKKTKNNTAIVSFRYRRGPGKATSKKVVPESNPHEFHDVGNEGPISLRGLGEGTAHKPIVSYGKVQDLVEKLLRELECVVNGSARPESIVVRVGSARRAWIAAVYLAPIEAEGVRTVAIVFDGARIDGCLAESACISFSVRGGPGATGMVPADSVRRSCSCFGGMHREDCDHLRTVGGSSSGLIQRVLSIKNKRYLKEDVSGAVELNNGSRRWYRFWISYNRKEASAFRPCVVLLVEKKRRGLKTLSVSMRIECTSCRRHHSNRGHCDHELAVITSVRSRENEEGTSRNSFRNSVGDLTREEQADLAVLDEFEGVEDGANSQDELLQEEPAHSIYASTRKRNFISCSANQEALSHLAREISLRSDRELWEGDWFKAVDEDCLCIQCERALLYRADDPNQYEDLCESRERRVQLHTMSQGTVRIRVIDLICISCGTLNTFDGQTSGLFAFNHSVVYARDLLDFWLYSVCSIGTTFRGAYDISRKFRNSPGIESTQSGRPWTFHRKQANSCFGLFLKALTFPNEEILSGIFSCSTCERTGPDGRKEMDAIVIDGTAVGVLARLPEYKRLTAVVPRVTKCAKMQYLLRTPAVRSFVDDLFKLSYRTIGSGTLKIRLSRRAILLQVVDFILGNREKVNTDAKSTPRVSAATNFVKLCFENVRSSPGPSSQTIVSPDAEDSANEEMEEAERNEHGFFRAKFKSSAMRNASADVGRCFISAAIPGGVLRSERSADSAGKLRDSLRKVSTCAHGIRVCQPCAALLHNTAVVHEDDVPSMASFCRIFSTEITSFDRTSARQIANAAANLLDQSIFVRKEYLKAFSAEVCLSTREYTESHREGTGIAQIESEGWMEDAARSGEIFPGRPIVRPRVDFGESAQDENGRNCSKLYVSSSSHSAGIFTVQCACVHPKIIGLSVMDKCEGVSTALSVVLSRFRVIPRVVYYDNGCNFSKSVILRFPWLHSATRVVCDRFHYRGHVCSSVHDPDSYPSHDHHSTSGAESLNRLWNSSKSHSRFLNPDNLVPFLCARAAFINLKARLRETTGKADTEDLDIWRFGREQLPCECNRCFGN